jgi:thiamine-phosphate pyrophosphorylase
MEIGQERESEIREERERFLLAVITLPEFFPGEAEILEGMLEAGLEKLHVRKPGVLEGDKVELLERLAPRWASRLVLHGMPELACQYGIPQIHGAVELMDEKGRSGGGLLVGASHGGGLVAGWPAVSTSVHSWKEFEALPAGLAYAFISPLFDSISKRGYRANMALLGQPEGSLPCMPVGLGGIGADTIGEMISKKWKGAAVLGWVWEEPRGALKRYEQLKKLLDEQGTNH